MNWQLLFTFAWLLPGAALFALWKFTYWAHFLYGCTGSLKDLAEPCMVGPFNLNYWFGIGWWCMLLWFPVLLVGVVQMGLSLQQRLRSIGIQVPEFNYRNALEISPVALLIWITVTGVGVGGSLVVFYPLQPTSLVEWLGLSIPWMPIWISWAWLKERFRRKLSKIAS